MRGRPASCQEPRVCTFANSVCGKYEMCRRIICSTAHQTVSSTQAVMWIWIYHQVNMWQWQFVAGWSHFHSLGGWNGCCIVLLRWMALGGIRNVITQTPPPPLFFLRELKFTSGIYSNMHTHLYYCDDEFALVLFSRCLKKCGLATAVSHLTVLTPSPATAARC